MKLTSLIYGNGKARSLAQQISLLLLVTLSSCEKFVDIPAPSKELSPDLVFRDDNAANAAILGVYTYLWDVGYDMARLTGRSADELQNFSLSLEHQQLFANDLTAENPEVENLWRRFYQPIYAANVLINGLAGSNGVSNEKRSTLEGEARFLRAFCYFYLVNLFGEVPLITGTDYKVNAVQPRSDVNSIYSLIIDDLIGAQQLLPEVYQTGEKVRANKYSASALLARVYLYREDWSEAENSATFVINSGLYSLDVLDDVFLANSNEAILQFFPVDKPFNSREGYYFVLTYTPPYDVALTKELPSSFELSDLRKQKWVGEITDGSFNTYHFPYKYKVGYGQPKSEYVMVLRLAELLLIRAEAKAQNDKLSEAIDDLDMVRGRAGLSIIKSTNPTITKPNLLLAIEQERKLELFTEWGHRWFDLKRTNRAADILSQVKVGWEDHDQLYPIPLSERNRNAFLGQNDGY